MIPLLYYFLKVILCSGLLFLYYQLALRNKLFHQWNRFYLLAIVCLSLAAPLIPISYDLSRQEGNTIVQVLQVVQAPGGEAENMTAAASGSFSFWSLLPLVYASVSFFLFFIITRGLYQLYRLKKQHAVQRVEAIAFIPTEAAGTPYSFFKNIFWNSAIDPATPTGQRILKHEMVHVREGHSFDKLFMQLVLVAAWINPFFWLIRRELGIIHEFIADRGAAEDGDVSALARAILQTSCPQTYHALVHPFFQSPIKRRLLMMAKLQNPKMSYLGRMIALPVIAAALFTFALRAQTGTVTKLDKPFTVVLDAGHGYVNGAASGARSGAITEDDVVLQLARMIREKNRNSQLQIVLSRKDQTNTSLSERVEAARSSKADLFLSLHMDAVKEPSGFRIYIGKDESPFVEQSRRFGSILQKELSTLYQTRPQLLQRQMNLYVLDKNVVPSVIMELGSILNDKDRAFMTDADNLQALAVKILKAVEAYAALEQSKQDVSLSGSFHAVTDTAQVTHFTDFTMTITGMDEASSTPLVYANGKKIDPSLLQDKILKGTHMTAYGANDPKAMLLYGPGAKNGVLVFEDLTLEPMRKIRQE